MIDDASVIRRILEHLEIWNPRPRPAKMRAPPTVQDSLGVMNERTQALTYHPVPDIA